MTRLLEQAEVLAARRVARVRDALADSLAVWLPGVRLLVDAAGVRVAGRGVRARWARIKRESGLRGAGYDR